MTDTGARAGKRAIHLRRTMAAAARIIHRHWRVLATLAALFVGLPNAAMDWADNRDLFAGIMDARGMQFLTGAVSALGQSLLLAAAAHLATSDAGLRRAGLGGTLRTAFVCLPALLGLSVATGIGVTLGTLLLVAPGILLMLRWFVAIPARVAEGPGLSRALARSAALMRGSYWKCLALSAAYLAGAGASSLLVTLADGDASDKAGTATGIVVESILASALGTVSAVVVAAAYIALRQSEQPDERAGSIG